jgi:hypothetical protein
MSQPGLTWRWLISKVKDFVKISQVEKFNQSQKPAKWTQLLSAGLTGRGSIDFFWPWFDFYKTLYECGFFCYCFYVF